VTFVPGLLFSGFFDDAALFPPGNAPMRQAIAAHRALRTRPGGLVGPFVVPTSRLGELFAYAEDAAPLDLALIAAPAALPGAAERIAAHPGTRLAAVEIPEVHGARAALDAVHALADLPGLPAAVEVPRSADRDDVLDVLAGSPYRAKLRTGGLRADLFPTADELGATLHACAERGVAVKCTAGLHRAVRHTDPATGFAHHGFLNVLLAAAELAEGAPPAVAACRLREGHSAGIAAAVRSWTADRAGGARAIFHSFGSCSVAEPVSDLVALGLLPETARLAG
jgi:hypothetical protein